MKPPSATANDAPFHPLLGPLHPHSPPPPSFITLCACPRLPPSPPHLYILVTNNISIFSTASAPLYLPFLHHLPASHSITPHLLLPLHSLPPPPLFPLVSIRSSIYTLPSLPPPPPILSLPSTSFTPFCLLSPLPPPLYPPRRPPGSRGHHMTISEFSCTNSPTATGPSERPLRRWLFNNLSLASVCIFLTRQEIYPDCS